MTDPGWDDYIAPDPSAAVADVQDDVDALASDVNVDPNASLDDQLAVVDAQSSSYQAATDQASADGSESMADWQAGRSGRVMGAVGRK